MLFQGWTGERDVRYESPGIDLAAARPAERLAWWWRQSYMAGFSRGLRISIVVIFALFGLVAGGYWAYDRGGLLPDIALSAGLGLIVGCFCASLVLLSGLFYPMRYAGGGFRALRVLMIWVRPLKRSKLEILASFLGLGLFIAVPFASRIGIPPILLGFALLITLILVLLGVLVRPPEHLVQQPLYKRPE